MMSQAESWIGLFRKEEASLAPGVESGSSKRREVQQAAKPEQ
jgi:hypothetical protein